MDSDENEINIAAQLSRRQCNDPLDLKLDKIYPEDFFTRAIVEAGTVEADSQFGSVLRSGDLDNDGYDDLAIGAPFETVQGASDAGVVVIAYGGPGGISPTGAQWREVRPT